MSLTLSQLVDQIRTDHYACPVADAAVLDAARQRGVPANLVDLYALCDGAFIGEGDDFPGPDGRQYRLCIPRLSDLQTVQSFGYVFDDSPLYAAAANWWQLVDYGDANWLAYDATADGGGRILDIFHETVGEPETHDIVALSVADLLQRLLDQSDAYWFADDFRAFGVV